ncbi:hypothetical protein L3X38_011714 [Prunus dulcis]|uniref:Transposase-associated domain-containing protein n=1 Tax=Prunus dulcis TaxID=3755 RepID=A0AAD4ZFY8_PRUDU|nr:hypothetical protein L3X38_011714 [Prunus dulcis]
MDKSWMHSDRRSKAYEFGVEAFLNFAIENLLTTTHIRCPCVKCVNLKLFEVGIIRDHVYFNGIDQSYKNWTFHGEPWEVTTNAGRNVEEDDGHSRYSFVSEEIDMDDNDFGDFGSDPYEFANVIGDGDQPVYPGCRKYTKLSALVKLYNLKAKHGMSDVCFTELLILQAHNGEYFTLRAALMWTINDFPAYGNLSGCVVKGYKACPICGDDTPSHRLKNGHKICYIGHRKWLPINHPYRRQRAAFNGKLEYGIPSEPLTGEEVLHMVENGDRVCWKKKSIFFDLEY